MAERGETQGSQSEGERPSLSEQSRKIADDVRELGEIAKESAGERVDELRQRGEQALNAGRERAGEAKGDLERSIAEQPLKSVAIALGVGVLLGLMARR